VRIGPFATDVVYATNPCRAAGARTVRPGSRGRDLALIDADDDTDYLGVRTIERASRSSAASGVCDPSIAEGESRKK
jgi:hypothetical protein